MPSSIISHKDTKDSGGTPSRKPAAKSSTSRNDTTLLYLTIFVFRGQPDVYYKRHVLIYFTSPSNRDFHETVHAQHDDETSPWRVDQVHRRTDWSTSRTYLSHVNAGTVRVRRGQEMALVNIVASTPVEDREQDSGWTCQNFLLEGLQRIVDNGFQTQEWYDHVEGELTDRLLDGTVG